MNTPTTHTNGTGRAFDPNHEEWKELARQSPQKPLPPKLDYLQYSRAVDLAIKTGDKTLVAIVNKVLEFQSRPAQHPEGGPEPAHNTPEDVHEETEEIENASVRLPGTLKPESEKVQVGLLRLLIPQQSKEELKAEMEKLKDQIDLKKSLARELGKNLNKLSPDKKAACEATITKTKDQVERLKKELEVAEHDWKSAPVDDEADKDQPWFGKVYANCRNLYVKMDDGTYRELSVEAASGFLREWGINNRPDTQTTSPLDRTKNAIHNRHSVDWAGALAGYKPGVKTLPNGKKILITKGPKLLEPVQGEFPTITKFLEGMLRDQVVYFHGWMQHAVKNLYAGKIRKGQSIVFAGPIDSGKSVSQKLIITPLLGGRVAKPYAFLAGRSLSCRLTLISTV